MWSSVSGEVYKKGLARNSTTPCSSMIFHGITSISKKRGFSQNFFHQLLRVRAWTHGRYSDRPLVAGSRISGVTIMNDCCQPKAARYTERKPAD